MALVWNQKCRKIYHNPLQIRGRKDMRKRARLVLEGYLDSSYKPTTKLPPPEPEQNNRLLNKLQGISSRDEWLEFVYKNNGYLMHIKNIYQEARELEKVYGPSGISLR